MDQSRLNFFKNYHKKQNIPIFSKRNQNFNFFEEKYFFRKIKLNTLNILSNQLLDNYELNPNYLFSYNYFSRNLNPALKKKKFNIKIKHVNSSLYVYKINYF